MAIRVGDQVTFRPRGLGAEARGVVEAIHGDPNRKTTTARIRVTSGVFDAGGLGFEAELWEFGETVDVQIGELEQVNVRRWAGATAGTFETTWINVRSSNVEAIRWVGPQGLTPKGAYGLQVKFLAKGGRPSRVYAYDVPFPVYDEMFEASSKGKFVWFALRANNYPYRRIS